MPNALSMKLNPVLGRDAMMAVGDACAIAARLNLAFVEFEGNGMRYLCRANQTAVRFGNPQFADGYEECSYRGEWIHHPGLPPESK